MLLTCSYFEVHDPDILQPETFDEQLLLALINKADELDREHERALNEVNEGSLVTKTPWLRYTKWDKIFIGRDMKERHDTTDLPRWNNDQDAGLYRTVECMEELLKRYWAGYLDCEK